MVGVAEVASEHQEGLRVGAGEVQAGVVGVAEQIGQDAEFETDVECLQRGGVFLRPVQERHQRVVDHESLRAASTRLGEQRDGLACVQVSAREQQVVLDDDVEDVVPRLNRGGYCQMGGGSRRLRICQGQAQDQTHG